MVASHGCHCAAPSQTSEHDEPACWREGRGAAQVLFPGCQDRHPHQKPNQTLTCESQLPEIKPGLIALSDGGGGWRKKCFTLGV